MALRAFTFGLALLCSAWASGCHPYSTCDETVEVLPAADGGGFRCVRVEECPRPTNALVCTTDWLPETTCVSCTDTVCQLHTPLPCREP